MESSENSSESCCSDFYITEDEKRAITVTCLETGQTFTKYVEFDFKPNLILRIFKIISS